MNYLIFRSVNFKKIIVIIFTFGTFFLSSTVWAGGILDAHKYAWSNNVGYINFGNVLVNDSSLSGHAWSANKGFIKFNPAQGGVFNDGAGDLSGSAWGEQLGWIDFNNVSINPATGKFSGTAVGALSGTITFDCPTYCDVETDWRQAPPPPSGGGGGGIIILPNINLTSLINTVPFESNIVIDPGFPETGSYVKSFIEPAPVLDKNTEQAYITNALSADFLNIFSEPTEIKVAPDEPVALFDIVSEPIEIKVAPGELLPVSVKLSNFGGNKRADVLITYSIVASTGEEIYSTSETVAVETTANFIKTIQIPSGTAGGVYTSKTSITYEGQLVPATTDFPFTVERKIVGLFQSDFLLYGGIVVLAGILMFALGRILIKHRRKVRFAPLDYSDVPHDKRIFYEIVSDTVMQMRQRVGDDAIDIASNTPGLKINKKTGRVLGFTESPSKIIATLVSEYEKLLGKKVSFSFRRGETNL